MDSQHTFTRVKDISMTCGFHNKHNFIKCKSEFRIICYVIWISSCFH